jgi:hypothetical protein
MMTCFGHHFMTFSCFIRLICWVFQNVVRGFLCTYQFVWCLLDSGIRNSNTFIHSVFCLTTGSKPPPKRFLHIVRSRTSSFKWEYPLLSLRPSSSFLRLLPRLLVTSISPCIFPSITCFRRQFLRKLWPIQLAFRFLISCRIFLCSLTLVYWFYFIYLQFITGQTSATQNIGKLIQKKNTGLVVPWFQVLSRSLPTGANANHKSPQTGQSVSTLRFEPRTPWTQVTVGFVCRFVKKVTRYCLYKSTHRYQISTARN